MVAVTVSKLESSTYLDYINELDHPLQILELIRKREPVFRALNEILTEIPQLDFFSSETLDDVLREIEYLVVRDRPIYKRWKQKEQNSHQEHLNFQSWKKALKLGEPTFLL